MVPARMLVRDRYDLDAAAANMRLPVLWFARDERSSTTTVPKPPDAYEKVADRKMLVWLSPSGDVNKQVADAMARWLDELPAR
jgi:hypothetical protein